MATELGTAFVDFNVAKGKEYNTRRIDRSARRVIVKTGDTRPDAGYASADGEVV